MTIAARPPGQASQLTASRLPGASTARVASGCEQLQLDGAVGQERHDGRGGAGDLAAVAQDVADPAACRRHHSPLIDMPAGRVDGGARFGDLLRLRGELIGPRPGACGFQLAVISSTLAWAVARAASAWSKAALLAICRL